MVVSLITMYVYNLSKCTLIMLNKFNSIQNSIQNCEIHELSITTKSVLEETAPEGNETSHH